MSDDLVERLLDWPYQGETMAEEAAVLIKQLTAERDVAIRWWGESTELTRQARLQYSDEKARAEKAEAERDRLREALSFYADFHEAPSDGPWGVESQDFGEVARAALKGETP